MTTREREILQRDIIVAIGCLAEAAQMRQTKANLNLAKNAIQQAIAILDREEENDY